MSTLEKFIARVEAFLARTGMAPSRFGEEACKDRCLVKDLRNGRRPNPDLMDRIDAFMRAHDEQRAA